MLNILSLLFILIRCAQVRALRQIMTQINQRLEAQGFGDSAFCVRNNKVFVKVRLNVWAEGVIRQCSCKAVTAACAVQTNGLCAVNEWCQRDCVTRSNRLSRTWDGPTMSYAVRTITDGRTETKQANSELSGSWHTVLVTLPVRLMWCRQLSQSPTQSEAPHISSIHQCGWRCLKKSR